MQYIYIYAHACALVKHIYTSYSCPRVSKHVMVQPWEPSDGSSLNTKSGRVSRAMIQLGWSWNCRAKWSTHWTARVTNLISQEPTARIADTVHEALFLAFFLQFQCVGSLVKHVVVCTTSLSNQIGYKFYPHKYRSNNLIHDGQTTTCIHLL